MFQNQSFLFIFCPRSICIRHLGRHRWVCGNGYCFYNTKANRYDSLLHLANSSCNFCFYSYIFSLLNQDCWLLLVWNSILRKLWLIPFLSFAICYTLSEVYQLDQALNPSHALTLYAATAASKSYMHSFIHQSLGSPDTVRQICWFYNSCHSPIAFHIWESTLIDAQVCL